MVWYGVRFSSIDHLVFIMRPPSVVAMDNLPASLDHPVDGLARGVPLRMGRTHSSER